MIRLLFIVPYPALRDKAEYILKNHPEKKELSGDIRVLTVDRIPTLDQNAYDAVIARGFSAKRIRQEYPYLPVIDLAISGYDILRTVAECRQTIGAKHIAICGFYGKLYEAQSICALLGCQVEIYPSDDVRELEQNILHARAEGCDAVIGGYSAAELAEKYRLPCRLIQTGEDTLQQAVDEAIRLVRRIRSERITAETYKTIIYASKDGILYVDSEGIIRLRNHVVKDMNPGLNLLGKPLRETLPYLYRSFRQCLKTGQEDSGQIETIARSGMTVSLGFVPVVTDREIRGIVITLSDITRIRNLENKIRRSQVEKGLRAKYHFEDIVHESKIIDDTISLAKKYAASDSNIIIVGETGTGKELFAQSIHNESPRKNGPFVAINCAALPENLLESELFGYVEGAFTGTAKGGKMGLFEQASGGTLFLDEIAEISPSTQSKLLRVLQEKEVRRIGDNKVISVDVRILSATNKSLNRLADEGLFRRDLMYRLDVLRLFIPSLRQREDDEILLFRELLQQHFRERGLSVPRIAPDALSVLKDYPFIGNIRELGNIVERSAAMCSNGTITKSDVLAALYPPGLEEPELRKPKLKEAELRVLEPGKPGPGIPDPGKASVPLSDKTREDLIAALTACGGNQTRAAKQLGIDRSTLWRRMKRYGMI